MWNVERILEDLFWFGGWFDEWDERVGGISDVFIVFWLIWVFSDVVKWYREY